MVKNLAALIVMTVLIVELLFCTRANQHKKKKLLKGWNPTKGVIRSIEKGYDQITRKNYVELNIEAAEGRTVYAKIGTFCIYEVGEEVELMEKEGVHRFRGNDRVDREGRKELLIGTVPMAVILTISVILSIIY